MKTLRIFLQFLFVVANVVAVVLLIVSAYSDRVSPETSMTLSYLGLAFPVLCVVNLCFIFTILFQILVINTCFLRNLGNWLHCALLCDFDVTFESHNVLLSPQQPSGSFYPIKKSSIRISSNTAQTVDSSNLRLPCG